MMRLECLFVAVERMNSKMGWHFWWSYECIN